MDGLNGRNSEPNTNENTDRNHNQADNIPQPNQSTRLMINLQPIYDNIALYPTIIRLCQITIYILMSDRTESTCIDLNLF